MYQLKVFYGWLETSFFDGLISERQLGCSVRRVMFPKSLQNPNFLLTLFSSSFLTRPAFVPVQGSITSVLYEN
jgi:hypothetical protein